MATAAARRALALPAALGSPTPAPTHVQVGCNSPSVLAALLCSECLVLMLPAASLRC